MSTEPTAQSPTWMALGAHSRAMAPLTLHTLFAEDPLRGQYFRALGAGFYLDYSKNRVTEETMTLLAALARERHVEQRRDAMFKGEHLNVSEDRPVLHVALRMPESSSLVVDGVDVIAQVQSVLSRMSIFAQQVRDGQWRGHTNRPIKNIVNIGIGGSHLGPMMVYEALRHFSKRDLTFRFLANVDATDFVECVRDLDAQETLFIVASKTFTTLETLTNATSARQWLVERLGDESAVAKHFVAISTNVNAVKSFGIDVSNMFELWDWVGGRYSIDSAIGLSTMLAIGPVRFREMLSGFYEMDRHFCEAPIEQNLPVLLGLLTVWNHDFLGYPTIGVMPYDQYLHRLPAYLQQLTMESNGKRVTLEGRDVNAQTSPVYWGEPGTPGQHSFYQLLHQGTTAVPVDFIGFARSLNPLHHHHEILMANLFAQAEALAFGKTAQQLRHEGVDEGVIAHRVMPGNRPSNVLLASELSPRVLGSLIALYEHSVFVQGTIWDVDSFDQWGVELGKELALRLMGELDGTRRTGDHDSSTKELLGHYQSLRRNGRPDDHH